LIRPGAASNTGPLTTIDASAATPGRTLAAVGLERRSRAIASLFGLAASAAVIGLALSKPLSHDEHQFVASGVVLAREGLLPYRDYPHFHMPDLAFVYAALFTLTSHYLFAARLLSAVCACAMLALIGTWIYRHQPGSSSIRLIVAGGAVGLMLVSPLFAYTTGLAWNHDLATLLAVVAFLVLVHALRAEQRPGWMVVSGALVGLAAGTRLSMAALAIPFVVAVLLLPAANGRTRLRLAASFGGGVALAMVPVAVLMALAPAQFVLGNLTYVELNTAFREQTGFAFAMSLPAKADYMARQVFDQPGNLLLAIGFVLFAMPRLRPRPIRGSIGSIGVWLACITLPFILAAALAPTPSFYQYFYAMVPFMVLGIAFGLQDAGWRPAAADTATRLIALSLAVAALYVTPHYMRLVTTRPADWPGVAVHSLGEEIGRATSQGRILTLAPMAALEGGRGIYPALTTGPFAWRVAGLLTAHERAQQGMIAEPELGPALDADPPAGVLVGFEGELETPLITFARERGYREVRLSNGTTVWVRP
jgi:4-amino-4-deoxy-L-arabinose transferase-like glycosyltransferase